MSSIPLHQTARWRNIAAEQIRSVGLLTRAGAGIVFGSLTLVCLMMVRASFRARELALLRQRGSAFVPFDYDPRVTILLAGVAFAYPFFIWLDEDPSQRAYHWMMPLSRRAHALLKVLAGWVWVMAATAVALLGIVAIRTVVSSITGVQQPDPHLQWWAWLVPFSSITIAYALASAAVVGTRRPLVRVAGVVSVYFVIGGGLAWLGYRESVQRFSQVYSGRYGIAAALFGQIYNAETPILERWLIASVIWGGIAAVLLVSMSYRRAHRL